MKTFKNWSKEDFTCSWDGNPTTVKKGRLMPMEDFLADHFAKHLVDRELQKEGLPLLGDDRDEMLKKCFVEATIEETVTEKVEKTEKEVDKVDKKSKKLGRPKGSKNKKGKTKKTKRTAKRTTKLSGGVPEKSAKKGKAFEDLESKNETIGKKGSTKKD